MQDSLFLSPRSINFPVILWHFDRGFMPTQKPQIIGKSRGAGQLLVPPTETQKRKVKNEPGQLNPVPVCCRSLVVVSAVIPRCALSRLSSNSNSRGRGGAGVCGCAKKTGRDSNLRYIQKQLLSYGPTSYQRTRPPREARQLSPGGNSRHARAARSQFLALLPVRPVRGCLLPPIVSIARTEIHPAANRSGGAVPDCWRGRNTNAVFSVPNQ